jgi:DNA-directed RNA polymerase subunit F
MTNTGERREIKRYTNAKENETVVEAKKLVSKTKQRSAKVAGEELSRERRNAHAPKPSLTDAEASDRMVDEGSPNSKPNVKQG